MGECCGGGPTTAVGEVAEIVVLEAFLNVGGVFYLQIAGFEGEDWILELGRELDLVAIDVLWDHIKGDCDALDCQ